MRADFASFGCIVSRFDPVASCRYPAATSPSGSASPCWIEFTFSMYCETDFSLPLPPPPQPATRNTTPTAAASRRAIGYLTRTTVDVLRSACLKTSFTSPLPGANQLVRVPLPNLCPAWFSFVLTASA